MVVINDDIPHSLVVVSRRRLYCKLCKLLTTVRDMVLLLLMISLTLLSSCHSDKKPVDDADCFCQVSYGDHTLIHYRAVRDTTTSGHGCFGTSHFET